MVVKLLTIIKTLIGEGIEQQFIETILKRLANLGYTVQENDPWAISFAIQKVENTIKNACNTTLVPDGLRNTSIDMICGEFLFALKQAGKLDEVFNLETAVKSVKAGDTDVSFAIGDGTQTPEQRLNSLISYLMTKGEGEFVCYRKIKW